MQGIQYATEIKVRAEMRCGELLRDTAARGERACAAANLKQVPKSDGATSAPTLRDMGLTRDESSRYQQLAAMPSEHFETAVATAKSTATAGEVTTDSRVIQPIPSGGTARQAPKNLRSGLRHLRHGALDQEDLEWNPTAFRVLGQPRDNGPCSICGQQPHPFKKFGSTSGGRHDPGRYR